MLRKLPFNISAPVLERFSLSEDGAAVVAADTPPQEALTALHKAGQMPDLVSFLAYGMPPREGVCWAVAVHRDLSPAADSANTEILDMAATWVRDPQEGTRIKLMQAGETRDSSDPLSWLCNAVAWNGSGSMGPPDGPVVLPPAGLHAAALLGAVALLAGDTEEGYKAVLNSAFSRGLEVAQGGWPFTATAEG